MSADIIIHIPGTNNMKIYFKITLLIFLLVISTLSFFERRSVEKQFGFYVVSSDSMKDKIKKGSIVISKQKDEYFVGDVIVFKNPMNLSTTITHRLVDQKFDDGMYFVSKGDSNSTNDPWQVRKDLIVGKVVSKVPGIGYVISFIRTPLGLILTVILPLGFVIISETESIYKEIKSVIYEFTKRNRKPFYKFKRIRKNLLDLIGA